MQEEPVTNQPPEQAAPLAPAVSNAPVGTFEAETKVAPEDHGRDQSKVDYSGDGVAWTASEYIAHHKSTKWYVQLGVVALILAVVIWYLTKDKISALVVIVGAAVLGGYGARLPRELEYRLDYDYLTIGPKQYSLDDFRSFSVDDQQAIASVNLMPLKRFAPALSIYFSPDDEGAIVDLLAARLPMETHQPDAIDRLMHRIRF